MLEKRELLVELRSQGGLCKRSMGGRRFCPHLSLIQLDCLIRFREGIGGGELSWLR